MKRQKVITNSKIRQRSGLNTRRRHRVNYRSLASILKPALSRVKDDTKNHKNVENKSSLALEIPFTRSAIRQFLGTHSYYFASGSYSRFATTVTPTLSLLDLPATNLPATLNSTICPEFPSFQSLFDEFKVMGIHMEFQPTNPYNRGAATASNSIAFYWDDDDSSPGQALTASALGAIGSRGNGLFVAISMDHSLKKTFTRPNPQGDYPWSDTGSPGGQTSSLGGLGFGINSSISTVTNQIGEIWYQYLLLMRVRI